MLRIFKISADKIDKIAKTYLAVFLKNIFTC